MELVQIAWWRWGLLFILFGSLAALWFWVHRGRLSVSALLKRVEPEILIRERRFLDAKTSVTLLEVGTERFLLAQSPDHTAWQKLENKSTPRDGTPSHTPL